MCSSDLPTYPSVAVPPTVSVTVNGVSDEMNDLLVVPPTGFVVNISYEAGDFLIDPSTVKLLICSWTAGCSTAILAEQMVVGAEGAVWVVPEDFTEFTIGSYTIVAFAADIEGGRGGEVFPFAVREFPDRKSTRLNSSHKPISYAVFCLKKKKKIKKK